MIELDGYEYHRGRAAFERDHAKARAVAARGTPGLALTRLQLTSEQEWVMARFAPLLETRRVNRVNL